jgi:hypothetical protein
MPFTPLKTIKDIPTPLCESTTPLLSKHFPLSLLDLSLGKSKRQTDGFDFGESDYANQRVNNGADDERD